MHRVLTEADAEATVGDAWDAGLRYFDTAPLYGHGLSETRMGRSLKGCPRGDFLVSTKVGRVLEPCAPGEEASGIYFATPQVRVRFDYTRDGVLRSFEDSLKRLGLDRMDILYVHDIELRTHGSPAAYETRLTAADRLRRLAGLARVARVRGRRGDRRGGEPGPGVRAPVGAGRPRSLSVGRPLYAARAGAASPAAAGL